MRGISTGNKLGWLLVDSPSYSSPSNDRVAAVIPTIDMTHSFRTLKNETYNIAANDVACYETPHLYLHCLFCIV